jgi:hypothetical protein
MKRTRPIKGALWLGIGVMAVIVMASSSPQCARSSDTGYDSALQSLAGPDPIKACERDCKSTARVDTRTERKRHRLADKACNGDQSCHDAEDALHALILADIDATLQACITACQHQQGAGIGGQ